MADVLITGHASLDEAKAAAIDRIERAAEQARAPYCTTAVGMPLIYLQKQLEAESVLGSTNSLSDSLVTTLVSRLSGAALFNARAKYPYLTREALAGGMSLSDKAKQVIAAAQASDNALSQIEPIRMTARNAIRAATTFAAIRQSEIDAIGGMRSFEDGVA